MPSQALLFVIRSPLLLFFVGLLLPPSVSGGANQDGEAESDGDAERSTKPIVVTVSAGHRGELCLVPEVEGGPWNC